MQHTQQANAMQTIMLTVDATGATELKVEGCPGPTCKNLSAAIERALGAVSADKLTTEYSQQVSRQSTQSLSGRTGP